MAESAGDFWRPEQRPCPCCGSKKHVLLGRRGGRAHRAGLGVETGVARCRSCHAVYPYPALVPAGNPYNDHSSEAYFHSHERSARNAYGRAIARQARALLGRTGTLLELGCGWGDLLRGARDEGWSVKGVEMTAHFVREDLQIDVEIAPVESARSLEGRYEVVLLSAILEHLYDPVGCLERVRGALVPGGLVFIDVPNECSLWTRFGNTYMRMRGRDWAVNLSPSFPPFHVVGFCPRSLASVLERCGFELVEMKTLRWNDELPAHPGVWGRLERLGARLTLGLGVLLGMGAGITCWARKTS